MTKVYMISTRLFFTFIPKFYVIGLIFGLLIRLAGGDYIIISNVMVNIILFLLFVKLGIILHEIGHLVFAKGVKGTPRWIFLGKGHEVLKHQYRNIKIVINTSLREGRVYTTFDNVNNIKLRYLFYVSGGFLTNLILAFIFYFFFGFNHHSFFGEYGIDIASSFIAANVYLAIQALIPLNTRHFGLKQPSDGLIIFTLPFTKAEKIKVSLNKNELLDALEHYQNKEYDKALKIYEKYLETDDSQIVVMLNLSTMHMKLGNLEKSFELLHNLEGTIDEKQNRSFRPLVYNNLAWLNLIRQEAENADKYSKMALKLNRNNKAFQGTRGSVLIETGDIEQGLFYLNNIVDYRYVDNDTLAAAIYLSYGYNLNGNQKEEKRNVDFVLDNIKELDKDLQMIWNIICKKTNRKI